jgi:hypothetical protein
MPTISWQGETAKGAQFHMAVLPQRGALLIVLADETERGAQMEF